MPSIEGAFMFYTKYQIFEIGNAGEDGYLASQVRCGKLDSLTLNNSPTGLTIKAHSLGALRIKLKAYPYNVRKRVTDQLPNGVIEEWY